MAHIELPAGLPGIIALLTAYPHSRKPLNALANAVPAGDASLTRGERELITTMFDAIGSRIAQHGYGSQFDDEG